MKKDIIKIGVDNKKVDLLIVSHIDQDHIGGAISFLKEISENKFDRNIVKEIWHNSYRHLNLSQVESINDEDYRVLEILKDNFESENRKEFNSIGAHEISAKQGSTLAGLIYKLGISWNEAFNKGPIFGVKKINIDSLFITILTPNLSVLESLKRFWRNELFRRKFDFQFGDDELFDDAYEFYLLNEAVIEDGVKTDISANIVEKIQGRLESGVNIEVAEDGSITNASSISIIIEEDEKRILLTADATDNDLFDSLKNLSNKGVSMEFDLVKLSHHGAVKNNMKWLSLVSARYYVISTDSSKHNHPDIESLVNLIINNKENHKTICFNNFVKTIEEVNNLDLMKTYNYSILLPNRDWGIEIEL